MIPSIEWTQRKFDQFNKEFFYGKLRQPFFEMCTTRSFLGQCAWKYVPGTHRYAVSGGRRVRIADVNQSTIRLRMSRFYDRPEEELENILIHEMIHVMFVQDNHPEVHHGRQFVYECQRIYEASGGTRRITTADTISNKQLSEAVNRKTLHVYILKDCRGRIAYASSLTPQLERLKRSLPNWKPGAPFTILGECRSSHDILQGRTPTIATYGTKCGGRYINQATYESLWGGASDKREYNIAC